jgi:hypothetical protein
MWLQPGEYTGDCNILYMWLQQLMCSNCKTWQLQNQNVGDCLHPYSSVIATRLMFAWCGCNQMKNTVDCLISYSVVATADVLRLQKKVVAKNQACEWLQPCGRVIAPLEQWFCKKIVAKNTGKKTPVQKKAPCHDTVRLRLRWSLLDVVATWSNYRWLQHPLQCICNDWCAAIAKKDSCKPECGWLQILSQCDCTLIAVWLRLQKNW